MKAFSIEVAVIGTGIIIAVKDEGDKLDNAELIKVGNSLITLGNNMISRVIGAKAKDVTDKVNNPKDGSIDDILRDLGMNKN